MITNGSAPEQEAAADEKKEEAQQEKKDAVTEAAQGGAPKEAAQGRAPKETVREAAPKETVQSGAPKETAQEAVNPKEPVSRITANGDKTVIVVDETSRNDNISNKILDRLTDQLEEEIQGKLDHYHMVNVMEQILKRMNLKQYLKQYDVCMCSRCQADVMALILTRLPAKYVVVDESSTAPIIGFYESKFKVRILTEIIKACMDVKENPRHDRSGPYDK
nr:late competence development ComFB family protein [Enterocloster bolteae]